MSSPQPWTCSRCSGRVEWRRSAEGSTVVVCPTHGVLAQISRAFASLDEPLPPLEFFQP